MGCEEAPRIAVPKEMTVDTVLDLTCSCSRAMACSARLKRLFRVVNFDRIQEPHSKMYYKRGSI